MRFFLPNFPCSSHKPVFMNETDTKLKFEKRKPAFHQCVNHTKVVYYPVFLKIGKEKKAHTFVSQWTWTKEGRKTRNPLSQWKQGFLSSVISLGNSPTLTKSWATYSFGQWWKMWNPWKISSWSSSVPDTLVIYGHTRADSSHSTATLRPTPHLRLLWGQARSMNKVVL